MRPISPFLRKASPSAFGAMIGSAITLFVVLVAIPLATAPHPADPAPCQRPTSETEQDAVYTGPGQFETTTWETTDAYAANTTVIVTFEVNTGKIHAVVFYRPDQMSGGLQPVLAYNEAVIDVSQDPQRAALMDSLLCPNQNEIPWHIDAWNGVLVRN